MTKSGRLRLEDDRGCFACGDKNPQGLRMAFALTADGELRSEFTAEARLQGFRGLVAEAGGVCLKIPDARLGGAPSAGQARPLR